MQFIDLSANMEASMKIRICPFEFLHVQRTWEWIQDAQLRSDFSMRGEPDRNKHVAYFRAKLADPTQRVYAILRQGEHIGNCGLKNIEGEAAELWIYIGEKRYRGQGIGSQAIRMLLTEADRMSLSCLYLYVKKNNPAAIALYRKTNFVPIPMGEEDRILWGEMCEQQYKMLHIRGVGRHYFIIAGSTLQYNFVRTVKGHGFITHVFDYDPNCRCREIADYFHAISIDEKEKILEVAKQYNPVAVVATACEIANISACWVSEQLGLSHSNSYETALNTTNKARQKRIMGNEGIPCARYREVHTLRDVREGKPSYPLVVKPIDGSAGRGVHIVKGEEQMRQYFSEALAASRQNAVLVEEVLDGMQYSIETISCAGQHRIVAFTEEYLDGSDSCVETQQLVPARLSQNDSEELRNLILHVLTAFRIRYGACHIEVKHTADGFKVIELASRMGAWRDVLIREAYGDDMNEMLFMSGLGYASLVTHRRAKSCIVKLIHHKEDYDFFIRLCKEKPELVVGPEVRGYRPAESKNLADAQGFYFIVTDRQEGIGEYLSNRI